jgi:uncharacterized DUF497 family protein
VEFEFDFGKSSANKAKHGIDFVEAQALWLDEALIEAPARTDDEPRFLVVGPHRRPALVSGLREAWRTNARHLGSAVPQGGDRGL